MKYKFLILILYTFSISAFSQKNSFKEYFNRFKEDKVLTNANISFKLVNAQTNKVVAQYDADKCLTPASIQKLITTGLGFMILGKNYEFITDLAYSGTIDQDSVLRGNLYILGGGDPTFASASFTNTTSDTIFSYFYHQLKQAGVKSISGDIIVNTSYLENESKHPTWEWEDIGTYYGAGAYSLNFKENAFDLLVECNEKDSVMLSGISSDTTIRIVQKITVESSNTENGLSLFSSPLQDYYLLTGSVTRNSSKKISCALQHPAKSCAFLFKQYLEGKGVTSDGIKVYKEQPDSLSFLARWKSPYYKEIASKTNSQSNNVFADAIAKQIAKKQSGTSSYKETAKIFDKILSTNGLKTNYIRLVDGSGLSRQNLLSSSFMCDFLKLMDKYPEFKESIPVPGDDGTMKYFMSDFKNRKKVRIKSGSMTSVISYAGYVKNTKGQDQYMSIIINNFTCKSAVVRKKVEELINQIILSE